MRRFVPWLATSLGAGLVLTRVLAQEPSPADTSAQKRALAPALSAKLAATKLSPLPLGAVKLAPVEAPSAHADDMVRVPLALEGLSHELVASKIRVTSGHGTITTKPGRAPELQVPAEGNVILSSAPGHDSAEHDEISIDRKTSLPWLVVETHRTVHGTSARTARPFLTLARAILWNAATQRHVADFFFGLDPESGEAGPLSHPIDARFSVTCDRVSPAEAHVTQVGPSGYGTVTVECSPTVKNESPEQFLEVHVDQGNLRYPFKLPHRPGPLVLLASSTRVLGFGFGTTVLTVTQTEEDGSPLLADSDLPVQLLVGGGGLDVSAVTLPRGRHVASAEVHPPGVGHLELTAVSGPLRSVPLSIELAWPVLPVLAMIAGGALGGFLFAFRRRTGRRLRARAFEGALVGLLVTAIVLVLPGFAVLPGWARSTELGLFVLSAAAGFVGTPLIGFATRAIFPVLADRESKG